MKDLIIKAIDKFPTTATILTLIVLFTMLNALMWILTYIVVG